MTQARNGWVYLLLLASIGLNSYQSWKLQQLQSNVLEVDGESLFKANEMAPDLTLVDQSNGEKVNLTHDGQKPTLIYVTSPTCIWCQRNAANVEALVKAIRTKYRIVIIATRPVGASTSEAVPQVGIPIYAVAAESKTALRGGTPQAIAIDAYGKVDKVWRGAFVDRTKRDIESVFGVSLPGVRM